IGARNLVGLEAVVEHAELEPYPWQVRVDQQHALQRRDGAFEVAGLGGDGGEPEEHIEVGRLLQRLLEGRVVLAFAVLLGDAGRRRLRRGRHRDRRRDHEQDAQRQGPPPQRGRTASSTPETLQESFYELPGVPFGCSPMQSAWCAEPATTGRSRI